jgi:hypothetical protein
MKDTQAPESVSLLDWFKPTLGAFAFGALMYAGIALGARERPVLFGAIYMLIGIGAVLASRRLTKPHTSSSFGFYIFAWGVLLIGAVLLLAGT